MTELAAKINPGALGIEIGETAKIGGTATGTEVKQTQYGESVCFVGTFAAQRPDGVIVQSGKLYLPRTAESVLAAALVEADGAPIVVKLIIGKVADESEDSKTGYRWSVSVPGGGDAEAKAQLLLDFDA